MRKGILLPALMLAMSAACSRDLTEQQRFVEQEALRDRFQAWVAAVNNSLIDSVASFYASGSATTLVAADGNVTTGSDAIANRLREAAAGVSRTNFVVSAPAFSVLTSRSAAVSFRHSTTVDRQGGARTQSSGNGLQVWVKDSAGGWAIFSELTSVYSSVSSQP